MSCTNWSFPLLARASCVILFCFSLGLTRKTEARELGVGRDATDGALRSVPQPTVCYVTPDLGCSSSPTGAVGRSFLNQAHARIARRLPTKVLLLPALSGEENADSSQTSRCSSRASRALANRVIAIPERPDDLRLHGPRVVRLSFSLLSWLSENANACRVLHVPDSGGVGTYAALAKKAGMPEFARVHVNVQVSSKTSSWLLSRETSLDADLGDLFGAALERLQVENSDSVMFPDSRMKQRYASEWSLPERTLLTPSVSWNEWHSQQVSRLSEDAEDREATVAQERPVGVTVAVIVCDRTEYLASAVRSIVEQDSGAGDRHEADVLFVAACPREVTCDDVLHESSFGVSRILDEAQLRFGCVQGDKRLSLGAARNLATEEARSDIVVYLDDDDELDERALSRYVTAFSLSRQTAVFTTFAELFYGTGRAVETPGPRDTWLQLGAREVGFVVNGLGGANMAVNRKHPFWRSAGGFSDRNGCEDWEFLQKAAVANVLRMIPARGLHYRKVQNQGMLAETTANPALYAECRTRVLKGSLQYMDKIRDRIDPRIMHPALHYLMSLYEKYETEKW